MAFWAYTAALIVAQGSEKVPFDDFHFGLAAQAGFDPHRYGQVNFRSDLPAWSMGPVGCPSPQSGLSNKIIRACSAPMGLRSYSDLAWERSDDWSWQDHTGTLVHVYRFQFMAPVSSPYATFKAEDWSDASPQPISQCARMVSHKIHKRLTANVSPATTRIGNQPQWCSFIQGDLFQDSLQHWKRDELHRSSMTELRRKLSKAGLHYF